MQSEGTSRADLHVHSKYSNRPSEWFLRRVGAPECFVEPLEVHRQATRKGMDFVTIADHNCIRGAQEIAHLRGTFLSCEVTTYFPENGCKVHCLVSGIDETQFEMIQELRASIYDLQQYLVDEDIICSITHPLYRVNDRLLIDQVEKLLVMFNRFEAINGSRDPRSALMFRALLDNLTQEHIEEMASRHGLEPVGPHPWKKATIGGSDDHSGIHIASAHTVTPKADTVDEFLAHLRAGRHESAGHSGGSLLLAHSLYQIAYSYYKSRFLTTGTGKPSLIGEILGQLLERSEQRRPGKLMRFVPGFVVHFVRSRRMKQLSEVERLIVDEMSTLVGFDERGASTPTGSDHRHVFETVSRIAHLLGFNLLRRWERHLSEGSVAGTLQAMMSMGTVALGVAPYFAAFSTQHKDEGFLQALARHFPGLEPLAQPRGARAWVTDAYAPDSSLGRLVRGLTQAAAKAGDRLPVITSTKEPDSAELVVCNFPPVGTFGVRETEGERVVFPPSLEIIEFIENQQFDELIVATPGPMGLTALAAGRLLNLRLTGVYSSDLPRMVMRLTRDEAMERVAWRYLVWFYSQMDAVLVPNEHDCETLIREGLSAEKLVRLDDAMHTAKASTWNHVLEQLGNVHLARTAPDDQQYRQSPTRESVSDLIVMDVA